MFNKIVLYALFVVSISFNGFAGEYSSQLSIGILRHLTIEEAQQKNIDSEAEKLLFQAAELRGHRIEFVNPMELTLSTEGEKHYDVIISRAEIDDIYEPSADNYFRALDYFEVLGIPVINGSKATLNAQDKFRTLMMAKKAGVRVPLTYMAYSLNEVQHLVSEQKISYPFFVKKPYGGAGSGVFLVKNEEMLAELLNKSFKKGEAILLEERIDLETDESGNVKDMRIWVVRDPISNKPKFIGGTYRTANKGHYLTNLYAGGTVTPLLPPYDSELVEMSEKALESINGDVAGIDIGRDKSGNLYLIEVNISFYTGKVFLDAIGINIWDHVMDLAEARAKSH